VRIRRLGWLVLVVALLLPVAQTASAQQSASEQRIADTSLDLLDIEAPGYALDLELVASGFVQPTDIVDPGDGSGRLFVVQRHGRIAIVQHGSVLEQPFLDISDRLVAEGWEQGLLGLAFHPDFETNGTFFITFSPAQDEWRLERWSVSDNANVADPASARTVLSIPHPFENHYGGKILFGPDGMLWISIGDGGGLYDPNDNAQNLNVLHGKLLRIDIDSGDPYSIPDDNPFVGVEGARGEIWAYGLRNPWRFSFDRLTGDLYIGDVGESSFEEINREPAGSDGGLNYGWPFMEGDQCSPAAPDCDPSLYVHPIAQHGRADGCSVTGGYVYRADPESALYGTYVYADFCNGTIWTASNEDGEWTSGIRLRTPLSISAFGQDADGHLYITDFTRGAIYRLVATEGVDAPQILRTDPIGPMAGGVTCTMTIRGYGFAPDAEVIVDGQSRAFSYIDSTWLEISLTAEDTAAGRGFSLVVSNADGQHSNVFQFGVFDYYGGNGAISDRWERDDLVVMNRIEDRTWMWGDGGLTCAMAEDYAEGPNGQRMVQYFDKSRMEITDPQGDPNSTWYVTNGLLVTELITGNLQLGDNLFDERAPAAVNVAGDPNDPNGPTYATFSLVRDNQPLPLGTTLTQRIDRDGGITDDDALAIHGATVAWLDEVTNHAIASPFWEYMNASGTVYKDGEYVVEPLFENPYYATGRPITEAYWATVKVGGVDHEVLTQCFERRCLTYTPDNAEGWQVEAGNVGQHYYRWRYGR